MTFSSQTFVLAVSGASRTRTVGALGTLSCLTFDLLRRALQSLIRKAQRIRPRRCLQKFSNFYFILLYARHALGSWQTLCKGTKPLKGPRGPQPPPTFSVFSQLCARLMEQPKVTECSVHSGKPSEDYQSSCKPLDDSSTARETALNAQLGKYHLTA